MCEKARCVIVGGAGINDYDSARGYLRDDDFVIYCDSGLKHMEGLGAAPSLLVGDWDSHKDPGMDVETITLPVAKDDTDTVYAMREGVKRGFRDFLLLGVMGARLDHTLVNVYILTALENRGCRGIIVDDYSEMELIASRTDAARSAEITAHDSAEENEIYESAAAGAIRAGVAEVDDRYAFFSLVAIEGAARGVTIRNAKFEISGASIGPEYQYATSNEVLPGRTAEITVEDGRLLLIKIKE